LLRDSLNRSYITFGGQQESSETDDEEREWRREKDEMTLETNEKL